MSSKIHISKLLVCVWRKRVDSSVDVCATPYTYVIHFRQSWGLWPHHATRIRIQDSSVQATKPQTHVINHSGKDPKQWEKLHSQSLSVSDT